MNYPRIIAKVYNEPWCITQEKHYAIQSALDMRLSGALLPIGERDSMAERMVEGDIANIRVIPVHGIMGKHLSGIEMDCGGCSVDSVSGMLDAAAADESVAGILLDINSPGGTVAGIPELGAQIAAITTRKPVVGFTDLECCSAAYWTASQCTAIYGTPSSCIGSIGVYMATLDKSRALEDAGIKVNAFSAGKYKLSGAPFKPLTDEERQMFQNGVDKIYNQFKGAVTSKRRLKDEHMQGQTFDGDEAANIGMIDGVVQSMNEALGILAALTKKERKDDY